MFDLGSFMSKEGGGVRDLEYSGSRWTGNCLGRLWTSLPLSQQGNKEAADVRAEPCQITQSFAACGKGSRGETKACGRWVLSSTKRGSQSCQAARHAWQLIECWRHWKEAWLPKVTQRAQLKHIRKAEPGG